MLKRFLKVSACFLLAFALADLFFHGDLIVRGADDAISSVANADDAVRQAFNAALDAEKAGANVSGLLVRLDEAGSVLGEAEIAFRNGNLSEAAGKANQCIGIAQSIVSAASVSKTSALDNARTMFWTYLTFSVVSIAVFIVVLALGLRRFRRGYIERMSGMKPEVTSGEA